MNLATLEGWLTDQVEQYVHGSDDALLNAILQFRDPPMMRELLEVFQRDEQQVRNAADRSYIHPNGFIKIVLLANKQLKLRLHIWPANVGEQIEENIHNHAWDFSSLLLIGGLRFQEFRMADTGTTFQSYTYDRRSDQSNYSLLPSGELKGCCTFDALLTAHAAYNLRADALHRILSVPQQTTATLVLQGPRYFSPVQVLANRHLNTGSSVHLTRLSGSTLVRHIADLQSLIE